MCLTLGIFSCPPLPHWLSHMHQGCEWPATMALLEDWRSETPFLSLAGVQELLGISHTQVATSWVPAAPAHCQTSPEQLFPDSRLCNAAPPQQPQGYYPPIVQRAWGRLHKSHADSWYVVLPCKPLLNSNHLYLFLLLPISGFLFCFHLSCLNLGTELKYQGSKPD